MGLEHVRATDCNGEGRNDSRVSLSVVKDSRHTLKLHQSLLLKGLILFLLFFPEGVLEPALALRGESQFLDLPFPDRIAKDGRAQAWQIQKYKGSPDIQFERDGKHVTVRLKACGTAAFGLKRAVNIDTAAFPFILWQWKADQLPAGGDIRRADCDDQVLQVYVAFPSRGFPASLNSPTIAYIWDTEAPKNLCTSSPQARLPYVRYMVLRNKTDALGKWYSERRNLAADFQKLFPEIRQGGPAPVQGIMIFLNTHHTGSCAAGCLRGLRFSKS